MEVRIRFGLSLAAAALAMSMSTSGAVRAEEGKAQAEAEPETKSATNEGEPASTAELQPEAGRVVPLGIAGLRVVVDPETGRIVGEPPSGVSMDFVVGRDLLRRMETSHDGLVVEPVAGGGVRVDLKDRFLSPLMAAVGPAGNVSFGHVSLAPPPGSSREDTREEGDDDAP